MRQSAAKLIVMISYCLKISPETALYFSLFHLSFAYIRNITQAKILIYGLYIFLLIFMNINGIILVGIFGRRC